MQLFIETGIFGQLHDNSPEKVAIVTLFYLIIQPYFSYAFKAKFKYWYCLRYYMILLKELIDPKIIRIIELFLDDKTKSFHLTDISSKSKVPPATTYRLIKKLVGLQLIEFSFTGKLKIYTYNDSKKLEKFEEMMRLQI